MEVTALFQFYFLRNACLRVRMIFGWRHLCRIDHFVVYYHFDVKCLPSKVIYEWYVKSYFHLKTKKNNVLKCCHLLFWIALRVKNLRKHSLVCWSDVLFIPYHTKWQGIMVSGWCPCVRPSMCLLSPWMSIYWLDMNLVLAVYSISVKKKYPINWRHLLGILGSCRVFWAKTFTL